VNIKVKSLSKNSRHYANHSSLVFKNMRSWWLKNTNWLIWHTFNFHKKHKHMNCMSKLIGTHIAFI